MKRSKSKGMRRVRFLDTTLREGAQAPGNRLTPRQAVEIACNLEAAGVDAVEAGFPASSSADDDAVRRVSSRLETVEVVALARACDSDILAAASALSGARSPRLHVFLPTSPLHRRWKLRMRRAKILQVIDRAIRLAASLTPLVTFTPEDATRTEQSFLFDAITVAAEAGACCVNIADTVGTSLPEQFGQLVQLCRSRLPGTVMVSCHCHNDLGLAVANTIAAIVAGADEVHVTVNGLGERAGLAALEEVALVLECHSEDLHVSHSIGLSKLLPLCQRVWSAVQRRPSFEKPLSGRNYFRHEAGVHQDGVLRQEATYHPFSPSLVSAEPQFVFGLHSGRSILRHWLHGTLGTLTPAEQMKLTERLKESLVRSPRKFLSERQALAMLRAIPAASRRGVRRKPRQSQPA